MGEIKTTIRILVSEPEERKLLRDLDIDGKIKLNSILMKWIGRVEAGFLWLWIGSRGGLL
jgi:hypothetical protein